MIETGHRLNYSLSLSGFRIIDTFGGGFIIFNDNQFEAFQIEQHIALTHLRNLIEAINSFKRTYSLRKAQPYANEGQCLISETPHSGYVVSAGSRTATIKDLEIKSQLGFDHGFLLSCVNKAYAEIARASLILTPKVDIVRRVPDAGLLVWVFNSHSIVCYEKDVKGSLMMNCLIDGTYYEEVLVSTSKEEMRTRLFTTDFKQIIEYPYDESIAYFYKPDEDII